MFYEVAYALIQYHHEYVIIAFTLWFTRCLFQEEHHSLFLMFFETFIIHISRSIQYKFVTNIDSMRIVTMKFYTSRIFSLLMVDAMHELKQILVSCAFSDGENYSMYDPNTQIKIEMFFRIV
jgi:hypothetical protein